MDTMNYARPADYFSGTHPVDFEAAARQVKAQLSLLAAQVPTIAVFPGQGDQTRPQAAFDFDAALARQLAEHVDVWKALAKR